MARRPARRRCPTSSVSRQARIGRASIKWRAPVGLANALSGALRASGKRGLSSLVNRGLCDKRCSSGRLRGSNMLVVEEVGNDLSQWRACLLARASARTGPWQSAVSAGVVDRTRMRGFDLSSPRSQRPASALVTFGPRDEVFGRSVVGRARGSNDRLQKSARALHLGVWRKLTGHWR